MIHDVALYKSPLTIYELTQRFSRTFTLCVFTYYKHSTCNMINPVKAWKFQLLIYVSIEEPVYLSVSLSKGAFGLFILEVTAIRNSVRIYDTLYSRV